MILVIPLLIISLLVSIHLGISLMCFSLSFLAISASPIWVQRNWSTSSMTSSLNGFTFISANVETNIIVQINSIQLDSPLIIIQSRQEYEMGNNGTSYIEQRLGNPFFATDKSQASQAAQVLNQFKLVSTYQDELFERCSVIEHKQSCELIVAKQINCASEPEMNRMFQEFERRRDVLTSENLVRLRYVIKKKSDGMFSDQYKVLLFFDYVLTNAEVEYNNRVQKRNPFSADEINIIITGAIRGYSSLEGQQIPNDKVRLKNIYFGIKDKSTNIKVIDSKLFPTDNNINAVKNRKDDIQDVFLAPQQLRGSAKSEKAGVFSLGICMMQLCLLQPCRVLYNYQNSTVNYKEIETRLNIIKNKYPLSVFYLIREMLERNQDSRPSFTKLAENLPTNIKNLPQTINLSVVGRTTEHITKDPKFKTKVLPPLGYSKSIVPVPIEQSQRNMHQTSLASQYRPQVNSSQLYTNGNMYTGQKKDDLRHGKGKYLYGDGSYYYGDWFKGKMEGQGKLYDPDGNLEYDGEWRNDHYDGKGILYGLNDVDWIKYVGEFKAGKMEGFGEMYFKDGNKYKGEFRSDYPWGKGRMIMKTGEIQTGTWQRGQYRGQF